MPPLEEMEQNDRIVVWPRTGTDHRGEPVVGAPSEYGARFERVRREAVDATGARVNLVGILQVRDSFPLGSLVWLGTLEDWYGVGSSAADGSQALLYRIETQDTIPDLKGRMIERELGLSRFRGRLP